MRGAGLAAALALSACAHAGSGARTVQVEGVAPLDGRGEGDARERALADARRRAVESVAGATVEGRSRVSGAVTTESEVTTRSRGFVEASEIVDEGAERGLWRVTVRARVREEPLTKGTVPFVNLRMEPGALADGVARALRERKIETSASAPPLTGAARVAALPSSLVAGTVASRARATLSLGDLRASGEASALDPDSTIAEEKALEAAGYRAGLALADSLNSRQRE